jgi:hypothetical protein
MLAHSLVTMAGGQPEPETEKVAGDGMQVEGAMGLGAVQEDGDAGDGDMGQGQGDEHVTPPGKLDQAIDVIGHSVFYSRQHDRILRPIMKRQAACPEGG